MEDRPKYLTEAGRRTVTELNGTPDYVAKAEANYAERARVTDEEWTRLTLGYIMNGMYSRTVLSTAVRELCAVAALTVTSAYVELRAHIRFALRLNKPEHVREVILQMSVYGGFPSAFEALRIYQEVAAEPEFASAQPAG
jgi:4-carboxymuconolactone decarboxylase